MTRHQGGKVNQEDGNGLYRALAFLILAVEIAWRRRMILRSNLAALRP